MDQIGDMIESLTKAELIHLINAIRQCCRPGIRHSDILQARHDAAQIAADRAFSDFKVATQARTLAQDKAMEASARLGQAAKSKASISALRKFDRDAQIAEDALRVANNKVGQLWQSYQRNSDKAKRLWDDAQSAREKEF